MTSPTVKPDMDEAGEQPSEMPLKEEQPQQEATKQEEVKQEEVKQEEPKQEAAAEAKQEEAAAAAAPPDEEIKQRLAVLLQASDLATTTEKMLRKQLEDQLGVKLGDKKALIRQEVLDYLDKQQAEQGDGEEGKESNESEEEEEEEEQPKKRGGFHKEMLLSEAMQEFMGTERASRTEVVKAVWDYVKEHELQNPKDKRQIIVDEKLGRVFTAPLNMFSMNKQISNHVFNPEDTLDGDEAPPAAARSKPAPKRRAKKAASDDDDNDAPKKKRPASGFAKPLPVSDELAAATGQKEMSRGAVTKWVFDYAKEHNLLDPSDKRFVVADETMQQLTGQKRFKAFGAISLLKQHFVKN